MVAASDFNVPVEALGDNFAYLKALAGPRIHVANKGAGSAESAATNTTAVQACIDQMASLGGSVFLGPEAYKVLGLDLKGVNLFGVPGASALKRDHATQNQFIWNGNYRSSLVYGVDFEGEQANSQPLFYNGVGGYVADVTFMKCRVNKSASLHTGRIISSNVAGSVFRMVDCDVTSVITGGGALVAACLLELRDGLFTMAPGATQAMVAADKLDVRGSRFRQVKTGVTATAFLECSSSGAGPYLKSQGARFYVDDSGAGATSYGVNLIGDVYTDVRGSLLELSGGLYRKVGATLLRANSWLDLPPAAYIDVAAAPAFKFPNGYRAVLAKSTSAVSPAVTFPDAWFYGQEFLLTYYNASASVVEPTLASDVGGITGTTIPTVPAGDTLTGVFVFENRGGSDRWVQKGTWGVGLTLV